MATHREHRLARQLLDRVRDGNLSKEHLRLAAFLGDPTAALALDKSPGALVDADAWAAELSCFGRDVTLRAFVALAAHWIESEPATPSVRDTIDGYAKPALVTAKACLRDRSPARAQAAIHSAEALSRAFSGANRMGEGFYKHGKTNALELTHYLGLAAADPDHWLGGGGEPTGSVYGAGQLLRGAVVCAANTSSLQGVRRILRGVLVPWALFGADPLRG